MKSASLLLLVFVQSMFLLSCSKDKQDDPVPTGSAFQGEFTSSAHNTSGTASINQAMDTLTLTNFDTDNGPDLNIYLAANINDVEGDFIDLGNLIGVHGTYTYDLPDGTNYQHYKYVVVWCVAFSVNFGYAELEQL